MTLECSTLSKDKLTGLFTGKSRGIKGLTGDVLVWNDRISGGNNNCDFKSCFNSIITAYFDYPETKQWF